MTTVMDWLCWRQPYRRWIVRAVSRWHGRGSPRLHGWLLDRLYPDDCLATFEERAP